MDANSSAEELTIKARKPYTITKQRERWTEEEHNRFLEALKLYGRAWQRIEEHIGTKTAVQIRSHAQKFFSKLEKEALIKGMPLGQSLDLDIPPPRPKRKPSNPYPRKTSTSAPTSSLVGVKDGTASSLNQSKQTLDLEKDPSPEKPEGTEKTARAKEILDKDSCSEVLNFFQEIPYSSISSESRSSIPPMVLKNPCAFREFEPSMKEISDLGATDESYLTVEPKGNQKLGRKNSNNTDMDNGASETSKLDRSYPNSYEKLVQGERTDASKESEKRLLPTNEVQTNQNYPGHVPVQFMEGVSGTCMETPTPGVTCPASIINQVGGAHGNPHLFANPTASVTNEHHSNMSRSSIRQSSPTFPPTFTPFCNNQDNYRSYLNFSNFSTLMVSNLLQNPAAHAAASLTASFWPCTNVETPLDSSSGTLGGFPLRHMSPSPNMAAIAAATVAAASAWWATHGMLPLCPPFHTGFTCTPEPVTAMPSTDTGQPPVVNRERKNTPQDPPWEDQQLDPEFSEAPKKSLASKSPPMSSSDSEESGGARSNSTELKEHAPKPLQATRFHDPNKAKTRKQVDRSSCGSNTPSSSEVETDTLEKCEKGEEDSKELELSHVSGEANNRRSRSTSNMNESWKEVSEEGRLAFQALFSREILPQSFSPPQDQRSKGQPRYSTEEEKQNSSKKIEDQVPLDLSGTWGTCPDHSGVKDELLGSSNNAEKGLLMTGLGHPKLKARGTGFKPYKRCSLEAKENRIPNGNGQVGEKDPKRIRLEGEVLT